MQYWLQYWSEKLKKQQYLEKNIVSWFTQLHSGHALGIWICGCSLFYRRELWASKSAGAHSNKSLKISGCKMWCLKDLRVHATAAPLLTCSLALLFDYCVLLVVLFSNLFDLCAQESLVVFLLSFCFLFVVSLLYCWLHNKELLFSLSFHDVLYQITRL